MPTIATPLLFAPATAAAAQANPSAQTLLDYCTTAHGLASQAIMQHADGLASLIDREKTSAQWTDNPADHAGRIALSQFADTIAEHSANLEQHLPRLERALGVTGLSQAVKLGTVPAVPVARTRTMEQVVDSGGTRAMDGGRGLGR